MDGRIIDTAKPAVATSKMGSAKEQLLPQAQQLFAGKAFEARLSLFASIALIVLLALVPLLSSSSFTLGRYTTAILYVVAALGLNLALGYAGQLVLGHAVIMAVGGYSAGMISLYANWSFLPAALAGIGIGTLFGTIMMAPGTRVGGWYLALVTLFSVLVLPHVAQLFPEWSGGEFGVTVMNTTTVGGIRLDNVAIYLVVVAVFGLIWLGTSNLVQSEWGLRFRVMRDAPRAAEAVGINLISTRFFVYVISSVPAATAGALLAFSEQFVHYDSFNINLSLLLLTGVILGGAGTLWGTLAGMAPLLILSFWVGPFSPYNSVGLGMGLLIGALVFTNGLAPVIGRFLPSGRSSTGPSHNASSGSAISRRPEFDSKTALIEVSQLHKSFGGNHVLRGIDLELKPGTLLGVVGPNGSGKSTFLNALSGFIKPDSGTIQLAGVDVANKSVFQRARLGIGRTFQVPQLVDELGPLENIEVGLVASEPQRFVMPFVRLPADKRKSLARQLSALDVFCQLGLPDEALLTTAGKIPLGLKRVVEVGRAIASQPHVLLLDEPTAGLDDAERHEFGRVLRQLQNAGMTILVVEHNVPFVLEYCDEIVLLEEGQISAQASLSANLPEKLRSYLSYAPQDLDAAGNIGEAS